MKTNELERFLSQCEGLTQEESMTGSPGSVHLEFVNPVIGSEITGFYVSDRVGDSSSSSLIK